MTNLSSNRRQFLSGLGALGASTATGTMAFAQAGATGSTGGVTAAATTLPADAAAYFAAEEPFFLELAKEFTLDPKVVYFMAA
jgi:hypothetical protein